MHLPTRIRKLFFRATGRILLADPVRNRVYYWAWRHLRELSPGAAIVDIGSRDSLFPVFLAWRRFAVRVVERDARFTEKQHRNAKHWAVPLIVDNCDFLAATVPDGCGAVCSLFSLQHAGDDDSAGYRKAARLCQTNGLLLSATEYRHSGTRFQHDRDDGSMRIYSPADIDRRIEGPLYHEGMVLYNRQYIAVAEQGKVASVTTDPERASIILLLFRKVGTTVVFS